jgi:hypothetical protein
MSCGVSDLRQQYQGQRQRQAGHPDFCHTTAGADVCAPVRAHGPRGQGRLCVHAGAQGGEGHEHRPCCMHACTAVPVLQSSLLAYCYGVPDVSLLDARGPLLAPLQDMRHFKAMLRKVDNTFVKDLSVKPEDMEAVQSGSASCIPGRFQLQNH